MSEIDHEKRNRLSKTRESRKTGSPSIAGAPVPGERERDLRRLAAIKNRPRGKQKRSEKKGRRKK